MPWASSPISHICDFGIRPRGRTHNWNRETQTEEAGKRSSRQTGQGVCREEGNQDLVLSELKKTLHRAHSAEWWCVASAHASHDKPFPWRPKPQRVSKAACVVPAVLQDHQLSMSGGAAAGQGIVSEAFSLQQTLQGEILQA